MLKPTKTKLRLDKTTLATLTPSELAVAVGGRAPDTAASHCGNNTCQYNCVPTYSV